MRVSVIIIIKYSGHTLARQCVQGMLCITQPVCTRHVMCHAASVYKKLSFKGSRNEHDSLSRDRQTTRKWFNPSAHVSGVTTRHRKYVAGFDATDLHLCRKPIGASRRLMCSGHYSSKNLLKSRKLLESDVCNSTPFWLLFNTAVTNR